MSLLLDQIIDSMSQVNDIMLLENPFKIDTKEYQFVEKYIINYTECGVGSIDILKDDISKIDFIAVKKWLNGSRTPRTKMQAKIKKVTKGQITGDDWLTKG